MFDLHSQEQLNTRLGLVSEIEKALAGNLITYVTKDTMSYSHAVDFYHVIRDLDKCDNLILFLNSPGGDIDAAYKLVSICKQYCNKLSVIIPFMAKSAATLLTLGADVVYMGNISELGPIDPQIINNKLQINGPCQAIRDCIEFIKEQIEKDKTMQTVLYPVMDKLDPWLIGNFERYTKMSRQYAERLLSRGMLRKKQDKIEGVVSRLTEGYFSHDYAIDREEARKELHLNVENLDGELWNKVWFLYIIYHVSLIFQDEESDSVIIETFNTIKDNLDELINGDDGENEDEEDLGEEENIENVAEAATGEEEETKLDIDQEMETPGGNS